MAAGEVHSTINGAVDIVHRSLDIYNAIEDRSRAPGSLKGVLDKLPSLEELLLSADAQHEEIIFNHGQRSQRRNWIDAQEAAEQCKMLCQKLHDLLLRVLSHKGNSVEALWKGIWKRLDILAKQHVILNDAMLEDVKLSVHKLYLRTTSTNRHDFYGDNDRTRSQQRDLINVARLAVNAKFYKQRVEEGFIRILTVMPGSHGDPVSCELQESRTKPEESYEPISYCWTYDTELVSIDVNGIDGFRIPLHLLACLQRIRDPKGKKRVWLDAICVNQDDEIEKSIQVRQMPNIYGGGHQTLVWLGETEPETPSCIVRAAGFCATQGFSSIEHGNMLELMGEFARNSEHVSLRFDEKYFMRVWWRRLWCLQEFMLSPRIPKVMIGPHVIRWDDFCAATGQYKISGLTLMGTISGHSAQSDHWNPQRHKRNLLELLRATSETFTCSDPKDRVFALLGLIDDVELPLQASYMQTTEEVYAEATMYLIKTESSVDMIMDHRVSRLDSLLPTWIPDLTSLKDCAEARTQDGFRASRELPIAERFCRDISASCGCKGSCIRLRAIRFDTIARRAEVQFVGRGSTDKPPGWSGYFNFIPARCKRYKIVTSGCSSGSSDDMQFPSDSPLSRIKEATNKLNSHEEILHAEEHEDPLPFTMFLDCLLSALATDMTRPPLLNLERIPLIGLLLLDFLYDGSRSLQQATVHYRRYFKEDFWDEVGSLAERHRLQPRDAILCDLQMALGLQLDVLDKVSRTSHAGNTMYKHHLYVVPDPKYREIIMNDPKSVEPHREEVNRFEANAGVQMSTTGRDRVFIKTNDQHIGVGPGDLRVGDEIVVPFGASRPWVLRNHGDHYVVVGDAFVPGIMTGQLEELWRNGDLEPKDYVLR